MPDILDRVQFRTVGAGSAGRGCRGQQGRPIRASLRRGGRGRHGVRREKNHPGDGFPDERGDAAGEFREVGVHRLGGDGRQDQPCRGATCGADGPEDIGPLVAGIAGCAGSGAAPGPDAGERALLANARVRHGPWTRGGTVANPWTGFRGVCPAAIAGSDAARPHRTIPIPDIPAHHNGSISTYRNTSSGTPGIRSTERWHDRWRADQGWARMAQHR